MSEEVSQSVDSTAPVPEGVDPTIECGTCGRVGGVEPSCELCGGNTRFNQARHYTLSEHRRGEAPDDQRYGRFGEVGPKVVVLPGGYDPRTGR